MSQYKVILNNPEGERREIEVFADFLPQAAANANNERRDNEWVESITFQYVMEPIELLHRLSLQPYCPMIEEVRKTLEVYGRNSL